ncbi:MAG: hypothetical protein JXB47_10630 [Anaerolineae bacterium]|nr:hypothetical protein [Anaerolineae bacterium]
MDSSVSVRIGVISPQDWGLPAAAGLSGKIYAPLGVAWAELAARADAATRWLGRNFDAHTAGLVPAWQLMAAYDRAPAAALLDAAVRAATRFYDRRVEARRTSIFAGGAYEAPGATISTPRTAEAVITFLGLAARTGEAHWLARAEQSGRYLIQARRHGFATGCAPAARRWFDRGVDSWGRVVEALLLLAEAGEDLLWFDEALRWGERAVTMQEEHGAFYLIDGDYYSSSLVADEIRALVMLYQATAQYNFLWVGSNYADWHVRRQAANGAWPMTLDRDGHVVMPTVASADVADIAAALLHLHYVTQDAKYFDAACRALRYTLGRQITPDDDPPGAAGGFWAWDPYHDYALSSGAAAHGARAFWWMIDYWHTYLSSSTTGEQDT